jgi:hypothetical protein
VVGAHPTGQDGLVVEPATVWMVHLGARGKAEEIKGTLTLGEAGLEFVERRSGADVRFDYADIRRAKRIRGSPVLLLDWTRDGSSRRTAFYFTQPPPLSQPPRSPTLTPQGPLGHLTRATPSKRQIARMNLGYLRSTSASHKETVRAWQEAVRERVRNGDG